MENVKIQNVVTSATLNEKIDLERIATAVEDIEYEPEQFPGLVLRLDDPKTATLVFGSGKLVCTGAKSPEESRRAIYKIIELLKKENTPIPDPQWQIRWSGDKSVHTFEGTITAPSIRNVKYVDEEPRRKELKKDKVKHDKNTITFEGSSSEGQRGINFEAEGVLTFDIKQDSEYRPDSIFIGKNKTNPAGLPFELREQPTLSGYGGANPAREPRHIPGEDAGYFIWFRGPEIVVQNIVASADLGVELNLDAIVFGLPNCEYEPEQFPGLIYRLKKPKVVLLLFGSGKIVCTGAKTREDVENAIVEVRRALRKIGVKM
ncbi:MAG: TATA-box-binding protein [Theionarchaea archaeon]|nr:TATA-box-binding protein [Theionarchaea archaeon]